MLTLRRTRVLGTFLLTLHLFGATAHASSVEVVESVPVETNLAVPGIRTTQQVWLEMINRATKSIDFEEFYIYNQPGQSLDPVLSAIKSAAARGVKIRFLLDSKFYSTYPNDPNQLGQIPNIQVKTISFGSGVQHSKYFVVDQSEVFLGSANLDWLALTHIHEVGLRISDPRIAAGLQSVFARDWNGGTPESVKSDVQPDFLSDLQLLASPAALNPPGVPDTLSAISRLIQSARSSLKIQVYQYSTSVYQSSQRWTVLDKLIRQAAARGVRVQLLVDAVALKAGKKDLQGLAALSNVEVRTVTIPQWSGGAIPYARLVHSKYFVIDGATAWVGSENWSADYFESSRNVGVALRTPDAVAHLGRIFDQVWNSEYVSSP